MKTLSMILFASILAGACSDSKFKGDTPTGTPPPKNSDATPEPVVPDPGVLDPVTPPPVEGITNTPNTVVFGGDGVYRVGDGEASNTSCKLTVFSFDLEGAEYSFVFTVEQDNTKVAIKIGQLCGIDWDESNVISVQNLEGGKEVESAALDRRVVDEKDEPLAPFAAPVTLNKGRYAVRVVSEHTEGPGSDRDDFVVGKIMLQADKPIVGTDIQTN